MATTTSNNDNQPSDLCDISHKINADNQVSSAESIIQLKNLEVEERHTSVTRLGTKGSYI